MKTEKLSSNVLRARSKEDIPLLIVSDIHFDSLKCDRSSLKKHFDMIQERDGKIVIIGDWFDVMGCYKDPRSKATDVDPKYIQRGRAYLDLVVEDSYEFLKPYRDNILQASYGNHENSILKHRDTDPLDRLVFLLNQEPGWRVHKGAYAGWIRFTIERAKSSYASFNLAYHHGKGGNAKRSKGILYSQLDAMEHPDAHMIVSGHDHNKIYDPSNVRRRFVGSTGRSYNDTVHWLKTGSYKKSADDFGWEVEKGFMPKRLGGWFVDLNLARTRTGGDDLIHIDPTVREAVPIL